MEGAPLPFDALAAARPFEGLVWRDVVRLRDAVPTLAPNHLLHAGPAYAGPPPAPVLHAAAQAIVFEGLAPDLAGAMAMIEQRRVMLSAAQDHGVVTPLAQVVSASMPMAVVSSGSFTAYAPLVEGGPPALRFGTRDPSALEKLRLMTTLGLERLAPLVRAQPVELAGIVRQALAAGDECHARTGAANGFLIDAFADLEAADGQTLAGIPGFVLTVLMAGAACRLQTGRHGDVAAIGGNGVVMGLRLHGETFWRRVPAAAPVGTRFPGFEQAGALGAIGDSAVLDFCGLGAQAMLAAPALCEEWQASLPSDITMRRAAVCDFDSGMVDADQVRRSGACPLVNLAILDREGRTGLIGRGVFAVDRSLFFA